MIALTFDIDWVSDELIDFLLSLLGQYDVKATIFSTHETSLLKNLDPQKFEISIHPNFLKGGEPERIIEQLKLLYPHAVGVRAHSLFIHSRLYSIYEKYGLCYSSDYFLYMQPNLLPVPTLCNMIQLPIYFMDDLYLKMKIGNEDIFKVDCLKLQSDGLKVFDFHPVHLFLNTKAISHYESIKKRQHHHKELENYRNYGKGIGNLFIELLKYIRDGQIQTYMMKEICDLLKQDTAR